MSEVPLKTIRAKTEARRLRKQDREQRRVELAFLLQDWDDAYNVGGLFRVADGCGASEFVMTGKTPVPEHPQIGVTSLGAHRRIPWRHFRNHEEACRTLKTEGWALVAVEIAQGAVDFRAFEYPEKVCLVLGSEEKGVYGSVLRHCEAAVYIPMLGKGRSLNVHVAGAIVGYRAVLG